MLTQEEKTANLYEKSQTNHQQVYRLKIRMAAALMPSLGSFGSGFTWPSCETIVSWPPLYSAGIVFYVGLLMTSLTVKEKSFLTRVRQAMPSLHPAERRLGDFVCDFPGELASYSGSELAQLAHVSKATVSRFVQRLGYESYEAARRHARAEKQTGSRLFLSTAVNSGEVQSVASHVAQGIANLEATFVSISDAQISAVVSAMLKARKVWVIGFRSSHPFAQYLQWQLTQVIEDIVAIPGGGQTMGEHLVSIGKRDLVIVLGLRRRVARMDLILEQIRRQGAKLLYITDEGVPFQAGATWHFRCHSQAPGPLFNHTAVAAVCHLLATRAIEKAGAEGRARLRGIEVLNDELEEL